MNVRPRLFLATVLTLKVVCLTIASPTLHAEESFAATHVCQLAMISDGHGPAVRPGIAIYKIDRGSLQARYRITLSPGSSPYTRIIVSRRTGSGSYETLQSTPWPSGAVTFKGSLFLGDQAIIGTLDSGNLYLEACTEEQPDGYLRGQIEQVPTAITISVLGDNETPSVSSSGEGNVQLYYDAAAGSVRYLATWQLLSGTAISAEFRRGGSGEQGPIAHTLTLDPGDSSATGTWDGISLSDLQDLAAGKLYFEISTASHPGGEIRGQLLPLHALTAAIEPQNEIPPMDLPGPSGTGVLTMVGGPGLQVFYVAATAVAGGIADSITGVYLRRAPVGIAGPVIFDLPHSFDSTYRNQPDVGTGQYYLQLTTVDSIRSEQSYISFETTGYPDGEMRGQLVASENSLPSVSAVPVLPLPAGEMMLSLLQGNGKLMRKTWDAMACSVSQEP